MPADQEITELTSLPSPQEGEIRMTRAEAVDPANLKFMGMHCRIWEPNHEQWWLGRNDGYAQSRAQAVRWRVNDAIIAASDSQVFYIEGGAELETPKDAPVAPKRKCNAVSYLGPTIVDMLKAAPNNVTFRAKLMAILKEHPPAEADTWPKIKDWVEFNFPKEGTPNPKGEGISISTELSYEESGRCHYSVNRSGRGIIKLGAKQLFELMGNAEDWDSFLCDVRVAIEEQAYEQIDCEYGDEETSDHDANGEEDRSVDYSSALLEIALRAFIQANADEEDVERLGLQ